MNDFFFSNKENSSTFQPVTIMQRYISMALCWFFFSLNCYHWCIVNVSNSVMFANIYSELWLLGLKIKINKYSCGLIYRTRTLWPNCELIYRTQTLWPNCGLIYTIQTSNKGSLYILIFKRRGRYIYIYIYVTIPQIWASDCPLSKFSEGRQLCGLVFTFSSKYCLKW